MIEQVFLHRVPENARDLTADWLTRALRPAFGDLKITGVQHERVGEGFGLASRIFRCRLSGSGFPQSVIVKLWSLDSKASTREISFYRAFGRDPGLRIPDAYYAAVDWDGRRGALVLEDLRPVVQGDCLTELPLDQASKLARGLACLHAKWAGDARLREAGWLPAVSIWAREADWFADRRRLFLKRFPDRLNGRARALLNRIEVAQSVANERLAVAAETLLHHDLHLDNVVLTLKGEPVLLDWAGCAQGPAALDLFQLLFTIGRPADRDNVFAAYLDSYESFGGPPLDRPALWVQLGGAFLRQFGLATCGVARWQPAAPREAAMIEVGLARICRALDDWAAIEPALLSFL